LIANPPALLAYYVLQEAIAPISACLSPHYVLQGGTQRLSAPTPLAHAPHVHPALSLSSSALFLKSIVFLVHREIGALHQAVLQYHVTRERIQAQSLRQASVHASPAHLEHFVFKDRMLLATARPVITISIMDQFPEFHA